MLAWRLTISAILIPALIGLFYLDAVSGKKAFWLFGIALLLVIRSVWEMKQLLNGRFPNVSYPLMLGCSLAVFVSGWVPHWFKNSEINGDPLGGSLGWMGITFAICFLLLFTHRAFRYREPGTNLQTLGAELLTVTYVGFLMGLLSQLRFIAGTDNGYLVLGSLLIAVKMGDVGGYTLGRLFGKQKMVPLLSPGKTWMGGFGALLGSVLGSWLWLSCIAPAINNHWVAPAFLPVLLYGMILGVVGLVGDLCESLIKRDLEQKDSALLLPGFGGLLDLLDSPLFAAPVAYLLWVCLPLA